MYDMVFNRDLVTWIKILEYVETRFCFFLLYVENFIHFIGYQVTDVWITGTFRCFSGFDSQCSFYFPTPLSWIVGIMFHRFMYIIK